MNETARDKKERRERRSDVKREQYEENPVLIQEPTITMLLGEHNDADPSEHRVWKQKQKKRNNNNKREARVP